MPISDLEDELIHDVLQRAWRELMQLRADGKIPNFDSIVPAQLQSWLEDVWKDQLETLNMTDRERYELKRYSIATVIRESIKNTIGLDYFMEQLGNTKKMRALDRFIDSLRTGLAEQDDLNRDLR